MEPRERKLATIVFADLVGSTALGGSLDPERMRALLDQFYDAMAAEIDMAGGTVEKFAGDAVMAVFGAPAALEDHAERALHGALAMQRRLREIGGDRLALRIGVNTGEVVVGKPREGSSFVTGDAVNVAARLEQAAEPDQILVGERTVASVRGAFEFGEPRTIEAKGKPEGVTGRRLLRALSLMRPRGVSGLHRAFVGRDQEMAVLERTYDTVAARGEPQLVTILGDAGVGKTRLLREFWDRLAGRSPEPLRRTGRCLSYGSGITYWPLAEVLKEHLGILESDPPSVALERLGAREILGLTLGLDVAGDLHPLAARDRFQDAWVDFLTEMVAERPGVVLIEDLHWAEDQLLDLLERLVHDTRGPLLLIATARPELMDRRPGWGTHVHGTTLDVEALSSEDAIRMLDELLGGGLPPGLREVVIERAEGNPFFVEELIGTLIDRGLLQPENGAWRLAPLPEDFAVPDTVQAVIAARVDLLEPDEKRALQAASVIGRIFWAGPVYELVAGAEPDLRVLEERDFIRRRPGSSIAGDREYVIKHALTREVAYASLPKASRAQLHAAFAEWLARTGEERDEYAPLLAHHYAEAARPEDADLAWADRTDELDRLRASAIRWLRRAAQLAIGRFEVDEGLALLHRAIDVETDADALAALWREVGRANVYKFDGEAFWTAMQKSLELETDPATRADTFSLLAFHTVTRGGMWKRRPAQELINDWVGRALDGADANSPARARALIARTNRDPEQFGDTTEARELAERLDDNELREESWAAAAGVAYARGDYREAHEWSKRSLGLVERLTDPDQISLIYVSAFDTAVAAGDLAQARQLADAHDQVTKTLSAHHRVHAVALLVSAANYLGRWDAVRDITAQAEATVESNLATPCALNVSTLLGCALASLRRGEEHEARRLEESAEALGMEGYGRFHDPLHLEIALARGDPAEIEQKLDTLAETGLLEMDGRIARLEALIALDRKSEIEQEASPLLLKTTGTYLEPFVMQALAFARHDESLRDQAIDRFNAMGMEWHAGETRRILE